jgi:hypothetical protein
MSRATAQIELTSKLTEKLGAAHSLPDVVSAYQEWLSEQMNACSEDRDLVLVVLIARQNTPPGRASGLFVAVCVGGLKVLVRARRMPSAWAPRSSFFRSFLAVLQLTLPEICLNPKICGQALLTDFSERAMRREGSL